MLNNDPLFQKLLALKARPALWLGKKSLLALEALVNGYLDACYDFQQGASTVAWFRAFDSYAVTACVGENTTCNAFSAILCCGYDDESGVDQFFALLERFAAARGAQPMRKVKPSALKDGEVRQVRVDKQKATEWIGEYLKEHCQELLGVQHVGGRDTLVLSWGGDGSLTCTLTNSPGAAAKLCTGGE